MYLNQPTLFIDRDGTLIHEPLPSRQIDSLDKLELEPLVIPALRQLSQAGFRLVMVSNQDGLGTDSFPQADFEAPQAALLNLLASQGIQFDAVYICPHRPEDGCDCRKPHTGLLLEELRERRFDPARSWVIGDRDSDLELARAIGVQGLLYQRGEGWPALARHILGRPRRAQVRRTTRETDVQISLDLDASGPVSISTGLGFFDHMLDQIATHGGFALTLKAAGDLHIDEHHTVEDTALTLGEALRQALGDKRGAGRFGFVLPMDEVRAECVLDLSGRPFLAFDAPFSRQRVGELDTALVEHFFRSLSYALGATLHLRASEGDAHHQVESLFKAFGRALRQAVAKDGYTLPSSKGTL